MAFGASGKDSVKERLAKLGFSQEDAAVLADHFLDAEARSKRGHGLTRVDWLESLPDLNPGAQPRKDRRRTGLRALGRCTVRSAT